MIQGQNQFLLGVFNSTSRPTSLGSEAHPEKTNDVPN